MLRAENAGLIQTLRDLAGAYIRGCSGCDKPTWWCTDADVPICLGCTMKTGRQATNAVPRALKEYLPPYPPAGDAKGTK